MSAAEDRTGLGGDVPWLVIVTFGGLGLTGLHFGGLELGPDEAQYWWWAQTPAWGYFSKPPLIAWAIAASTSLCGDVAACIRLPALLAHLAAAIVMALIGRALGGTRLALLAGAAYLTLPGVAVSMQLISTDPLLLVCWTVGLLALIGALQAPGSWGWPLLLGVALGVGLLAKQAMIYLPLGLLVAAIVDPRVRALVGSTRLAAILAPAAILLTPFLLWNHARGWPTFHHTAENTALGRAGVHLDELGAFLLGQVGLLGPLLTVAIVTALVLAVRRGTTADERLLLAIGLPPLVLVSLQALISRAHDNWAAPAYPALILAALMLLLRRGADGLVRWSLGLNALLAALLPVLIIVTSWQPPPGRLDVLGPLRGWRALGAEVRAVLDREGIDTLVGADRKLLAELLYTIRPPPARVAALVAGERPQNHFELTMPWRPRAGERVLVAGITERPDGLPADAELRPVAILAMPFRPGRTRPVHLIEVVVR